MNKDKCSYYPTIEEIEEGGPFCWCNFDISGGPACTKKDEKKCERAKDKEDQHE